MVYNITQVSVEDLLNTFVPGPDIPESRIKDLYCFENTSSRLEPGGGLNPHIRRLIHSVTSLQQKGEEEPRNSLVVREIASSISNNPESDGASGEFAEDGKTATCVDVGVFFDNDRFNGIISKSPEELGKKRKAYEMDVEQREDFVGRFSWAEILVPIEVEVDVTKSTFYFDDDPTKFLRLDTEDDREAVGHIGEHVRQIFGYQHRVHVYAVCVCKDRARLLYFDRQGALVSEPFTYGTRKNLTLHTFFYRLSHMSREQLGFDPTVVPANPDDVKAMLAYASNAPTDHIKQQIYRTLSVDPKCPEVKTSTQWPAYELAMCGKRYIIARPTFASPALYGRCTRGYLAYDIEGRAVRFLKDSWRPDLERVQPEHEVYERLKARGVTENVLTCLGYENVPNSDGSWQLTRTHKLINPSRAAHGHYRILFEQVCRPLIDFTDFKELTMLICDAIYAHCCAWEEAGILHRDVSVNNIMIFEFVGADGKVERRGMLCDWDLCKYVEQMESSQKSRTINRTGTWYFRSALSVLFPGKPYYLSDDIESFIHVYHYCVLRFHLTDISNLLSTHVTDIYEFVDIRESDGAHIGSAKKFKQMRSSKPPMDVLGNPTLDDFLTELAQLYSRHYSMINIHSYREAYNPIQVKPVKLTKKGFSREYPNLKRPRSDDSLQLVEAEEPKATQVAPRRTMDVNGPLRDHYELLKLFVRYTSDPLDEEKEGPGVRWPDVTTKCEDWFKGTSLAPHKNNAFSSSTSKSSQDVEEGRPGKKRKGMLALY
ncbi:hypothetical protein L226DRAFT_572499 [Lentinus tigrinus ALCF2SS1-7]|uniref:uncharacterized protein n=1 Tax=Lentinus tigrinus ALCF2SS1-7 TaxID=1328758 RepID=UPI001165F1BE|nr:hypothetical protein L226DRAFT_572499 [Lentinus tigrinus ALCF2SS1-7]